MSQFPHDDFVKEYLPELIKDFGIVSSGQKIASQMKEIDVLFEPNENITNISPQLGFLKNLIQTICLFEVYRNPVTADEIDQCLSKLIDFKNVRRKKLKKEKSIDLEVVKQTTLWILTPTLSKKTLDIFRAETSEQWGQGVYLLPGNSKAGVIVVHQLPVNEDTLWLRMLGKGKVQEKAIEELSLLNKDNPYRDTVLELVSNLFTMLELNKKKRQQLTKEDQELIMKLSPIYTARLEEREQIGLQKGIQQGVKQGIQQGVQQGIQQEASLLIMRQLKRKVGELSPNLETQIVDLPVNVLEDLGEALLDFDSIDDLTNWLKNHKKNDRSCN